MRYWIIFTCILTITKRTFKKQFECGKWGRQSGNLEVQEHERYHLGSQINKNKIHSLTFFIPMVYHETLKTPSEKKKIKINNPKNERS